MAKRNEQRQEVPPTTYLSTAEGKWTLIHHGGPLCATTDRRTAEEVARRYGIALPDVLWDGDGGRFVSSAARGCGGPIHSATPTVTFNEACK